MEKYHGLAAIQLIEHRGISRVAWPFVAANVPQGEAVDLQRIERVLDLFQTT